MTRVVDAAAQLERQAAGITQLCSGVGAEQARWRPHADTWSLLEVVNHLADEEHEDFRARLDCILCRPQAPWPPIDPGAWVRERGYNQRELAPSLARFREARAESLEWLRGLGEAQLERAVGEGRFRMRAGDMLAAWLAHDLLHMRQLVELQRAWTVRQYQPFGTGYAGDW